MADFLKGVGIVGWLLGAWLIYVGFSKDMELGLILGAIALLDGTVALVGGCIMDAIADLKPSRDD